MDQQKQENPAEIVSENKTENIKQAPSQNPPNPKQGKNSKLIWIIIIIAVLVLAGVGGGMYFGYKAIQKKSKKVSETVKKTLPTSTPTTDSSLTSPDKSTKTTTGTKSTTGDSTVTTNNSSNSTGDTISNDEIIPTDDFAKQMNEQIKPIVVEAFGGAKLTSWSWSAAAPTDCALVYTTTNQIDSTKAESAFTANSYTKVNSMVDTISFMLAFTKGEYYYELAGQTSGEETHKLTVTIMKQTGEGDGADNTN